MKVLEAVVDVPAGTVTARLSCGHITDRVKFCDVPTSFLGDDIPLPKVGADVYCLQCEAERPHSSRLPLRGEPRFT